MSLIPALLIVASSIVSLKVTNQTSINRPLEVLVFFGNVIKDPEMLDCTKGYPVLRKIPRAYSLRESIMYTLKELLKGPTVAEESLGYRTPAPSPEQIRLHKQRLIEYSLQNPNVRRSGQFWIDDNDTIVTLRRVKLIAYGGGSCRVAGILGPIRQTILQFPLVKRIGFGIKGTPPGESPFQP